MGEAVHEILQRIQQLPRAERMELDDLFARQAEAEAEWQREADEVRQLARQKDQAMIDCAVEKVRYSP